MAYGFSSFAELQPEPGAKKRTEGGNGKKKQAKGYGCANIDSQKPAPV
jgi:hypothetical protein